MTHAYLIMAHNEFELLAKLVSMLDYKNNDIYIIVDKKAKGFDKSIIESAVKEANVTFLKRIKTFWAGTSLIKAEVMLLREATKKYHDYYHLLSGVDLPIKTHEQIDAFFEKNNGKEFVTFDETACKTGNFLNRVTYFHLQGLNHKLIAKTDNALLKLQQVLKVNRIKNKKIEFKKGGQWFDITHGFAEYTVDQMTNNPKLKKAFRNVSYCDEVFMQTLLYSSEYYGNRATFGTHFIDWSNHKGSPEILTEKDFDRIINSDRLYARKFSLQADSKVVEKIINHVSK